MAMQRARVMLGNPIATIGVREAHMSMTTRQRPGRRRLTAAIALAALAVVLAPPPLAGADHACQRPAPASVAVAPLAGHCHHAQPGPCGDMLGCLATPVAVLSGPASVGLLGAVAIVTPAAPPAGHGRLATGPPTPPPNS